MYFMIESWQIFMILSNEKKKERGGERERGRERRPLHPRPTLSESLVHSFAAGPSACVHKRAYVNVFCLLDCLCACVRACVRECVSASLRATCE